MKETKEERGARIIEQMARNRGIGCMEVRRELEMAIDAVMANPDPEVREFRDESS